MDYGMTKGILELEVRAALAKYLLRLCIFDCTDNETLTGDEYQLYLKNKNGLVDLIDFSITPGQQLN